MKIYKLLFLALLCCFAISCTQDKFEDQTIDNSNDRLAASQFDNSYLGVYKGLFSTNDGLTRGSVVLTLSSNAIGLAQITLSSGEVIELQSKNPKLTVDNKVSNLTFSSAGLSTIDASLTFSVEGNGTSPSISNVVLDNKQSDILIAKNLSRAPLTPITGTYVRTAGTGGFPRNGRTWNVMAIGEGDGQTFATQIAYGGRVYDTGPVSVQFNCLDVAGYTSCDIGGSTSILGHVVTWTGTHTYATPGNESCSAVSGTWSAPTFGGSSGDFVSDNDCSTNTVVNDVCATATTIASGESLSGSTANSTDTDAPTDCPNVLNSGPGIWFTYTATDDGLATVDTNGSSYDTKLGVLGGTCGALTCIDSDDDGGDGLQSLVNFPVTNGETYYFYVTGYDVAVGTYVINLVVALPPPGDFCGDAIDIACGGTDSGSIVGASNTDTPIDCTENLSGSADGPGVWYAFTTPTDQDVTVDLEGSDFDTQLRVFSGSCGALVCVANDDDSGTGLISSLTFSATGGESYYFFIGGYNTAVGNYVLNVTCTDPAPPVTFTLTPACDSYLVDNGENGNYSANSNDTYVIDAGPGNVVSLPFTVFNLENSWDFMRIYNSTDGVTLGSEITDVNGRVIADFGDPDIGFTGTGAGANSLEGQTVVSTEQYLIITFTSDSSGQEAGFLAQVGCAPGRFAASVNQKTSLNYRPAVSNTRAKKVEDLEAVEIAKRNKAIEKRRLLESKRSK